MELCILNLDQKKILRNHFFMHLIGSRQLILNLFHCRINGETYQTTSTSGSFRSGDFGGFGDFGGLGDYGKLKTERPVPSADVLDDDLDEYMSKRKASKNDLV